jgi:TolB-like protein
MKSLILALILGSFTLAGFAEPRVLVLPFDPIIDSTYNLYGEQVPILNYQDALHTMIISNLSKREDIRVVEKSLVNGFLLALSVTDPVLNDPRLAAKFATDIGADYIIIGTYGEFSSEIRVDARIALAATEDVPLGNSVSSVGGLWEDLPTVADRISVLIIDKIIASGHIRPVSRGFLHPEGDLADFDLAGTTPADMARLVVWTDAPAPQISIAGREIEFSRCARIDLMDSSPEKMRNQSCKVAVLPSGPIEVRVTHRGFLPYRDTLNLAAGKAYRLEIKMKIVENQRYR